MKKHVRWILAATILFATITFSVQAQMYTNTASDERLDELMHYAYMNIETADSITADRILEARNEIIFSKSWVADGISGYLEDSEGNILEVAPQFSELFPADWDVPVLPVIYMDDCVVTPDSISGDRQGAIIRPASDPVGFLERFFEDLRRPPANTNTPPFFTVRNPQQRFWHGGGVTTYDVFEVSTSGALGATGSRLNIGYANAATGACLGWWVDIIQGMSFRISVPRNVSVAVRASTNIDFGTWSLFVSGRMQLRS
jgi:hypothetical protein